MRGGLIFPMLVDIARIDTHATRQAGKYDDVFRSMVDDEAEYLPPIRLHAQIEMNRWEAQNQLQAGNQPDTGLTLVFHFRELEQLGLTDLETGDALLRVNDKLLAIWSRDGLRREMTTRVKAGGLYATEVQPAGVGLGGRRNLLLMTFNDRAQGLTANP